MNRRKYGNKKVSTVINGETVIFDSKAEHQRYCHLKILEKAGEITGLELQPKYKLLEKFTRNKKNHQAINYIADFRYIDKSGNTVVEDVKGKQTAEYKIKKKIFLSIYSDLVFIEAFIVGRNFKEVAY